MINYFNRIQAIGIKPEYEFAKKLRIELCNLFIVISIIPILIHLTYNIFSENNLIEYIIVAIWLIIAIVILFLNSKHFHFSANLLSISVPAIFSTLLRSIYGVEIRIEPMFLLLIIIATYFFNKKHAIYLYIFVITCFLLSEIIVSQFTPPLSHKLVPSGAYAYLIFAITSVIILTRKVLRENEKYNEQLVIKNKQLKVKNDELYSFTYAASHDLRSPLTMIKSFSGLIRNRQSNKEESSIGNYLDIIDNSSDYMQTMINAIAQFSSVDINLSGNKTTTDLNLVVSRCISELRNKNESISCQIPQALSNLHINKPSLEIVISNIVENAFRYNKSENPTLIVFESSTKEEYILNFQDNGIGIEEMYHREIFDYFKRLHTKDSIDGAGLGLGISQKIITYYKGHISVRSQLGKGSIFSINLPISFRI